MSNFKLFDFRKKFIPHYFVRRMCGSSSIHDISNFLPHKSVDWSHIRTRLRALCFYINQDSRLRYDRLITSAMENQAAQRWRLGRARRGRWQGGGRGCLYVEGEDRSTDSVQHRSWPLLRGSSGNAWVCPEKQSLPIPDFIDRCQSARGNGTDGHGRWCLRHRMVPGAGWGQWSGGEDVGKGRRCRSSQALDWRLAFTCSSQASDKRQARKRSRLTTLRLPTFVYLLGQGDTQFVSYAGRCRWWSVWTNERSVRDANPALNRNSGHDETHAKLYTEYIKCIGKYTCQTVHHGRYQKNNCGHRVWLVSNFLCGSTKTTIVHNERICLW